MDAGTPLQRGSPRLYLSRRMHALRAFSFPLSVLPVLVAAAAAAPLSEWRWGVLVGSMVAVALLHGAGNLLNDYFDFRSGVDHGVEGDKGRPGRLLIRGEMSPGAVAREAAACLVLAAPVVAYLVLSCGPGIVWAGAAALFCLYAYTGPPFRLKYRALGEPVIFLVFGPCLVIGAAQAQAGGWSWPAALLSLPVGTLTTAVLVGNNVRDADEDAGAGVSTIAHRLGLRGAKLVYALCVLVPPLAVGGLVAAGALGVGGLLSLAALLPGVRLVSRVLRTGRVADVDVRTARVATLFFVALVVGMLIG